MNNTEKILLRKQIELIENELADIQFILILKDEKGYNKLLSQLQNLLTSAFDETKSNAINNAIEYLLSIPANQFNQEHINNIDNIIKDSLSNGMLALCNNSVMSLNEKLYKLGINEILKPAKINLTFDAKDIEAVNILGSQNLFWIGNYYGEQLSGQINGILKSHFEGKKNIEEVTKDFAKKFEVATDKGYDYFEGLAEHTANRVRELGKVTGYEKAGIMKYEIRAIMDDRTSEICQTMNGKVFEVAVAASFRDSLLGLSSPEDIKSVAPWRSIGEIKGVPDSEIPSGMELPPYHWRCRTLTVAYFEEDLQTTFTPLSVQEKKSAVEVLNKNENFRKSKLAIDNRFKNIPKNKRINKFDATALFHYTGSKDSDSKFFQNLNNYLSNLLKNISGSAKLYYDSAKMVINDTLTNLDTLYTGYVYRKVEMYDLSKYVVGDIITEERFTSTTYDQKLAADRKGEVFFTIKSKTGKYIRYYSANPGEGEVLFRAGLKYKVVDRFIENGITKINMEEL